MKSEIIFAALILAALSIGVWLVYLLNRKRWRLWRILQSSDPQQVEAARSWITPQLVPFLMKTYWRLSDWSKKRSIVELLQDQFHPDLPKLMLDFLRVPLERGDEQTELAQAIALGFIDERYDRFMEYYNDRDLLAQDVQSVLRANGMPTPPPVPVIPAQVQPEALIPPAASADQRLQLGIMNNNLSMVEQAVRDRANIDLVLNDGRYKGCSTLLLAMILGRVEIAKFLIRQGADIHFARANLQGKFLPGKGQTALWWAANHGQMPLAVELLQRGANLNAPDHYGETPLAIAASNGQSEMVQYLVEQGADLHAKITDGRKAFHLAVTNGYTPIAEILLKAGSDPNEAGGSGYTPLMVAVENNSFELAELLIRAGANVNAVHTGSGIYIALRGWTPLVFSVNAGLVRMTKMLIAAGANPHYRVPAGQRWDGLPLPERSLLDFATGKRADSIKKLLYEQGFQG